MNRGAFGISSRADSSIANVMRTFGSSSTVLDVLAKNDSDIKILDTKFPNSVGLIRGL